MLDFNIVKQSGIKSGVIHHGLNVNRPEMASE